MTFARFLSPLIVAMFAAGALSAAPVRTDHVEAELVAESQSIQPGRPFTVGLRMKMNEHWHTYWINAGDSGQPIAIEWKLPPGFSAGPIQWPAPIKIPTPPFMTYGYEGEILLLTEIQPAADVRPGSEITLNAKADWLVCEDICVPEDAEFALTLPVNNTPPSAAPKWAALFAAMRQRLPQNGAEAGWKASFARDGESFVVRVEAPAGAKVDPAAAYFFATEGGIVEAAAPQNPKLEGNMLTLRLQRAETAPKKLAELPGVLVPQGGVPGEGDNRPIALVAAPGGGGSAAAGLSLGVIAGAFLGGLILNLMPCVFPVLGIKVLGFVNQAGADRRKVTLHGLVFTAGVLGSFWVLAVALIVLRAGGESLGWGFQLQSPAFVFALAVFLLVFALNLSGLFEIGVSATRLGGSRRSGGLAGSFMTGVLATLVATPCAAPFLALPLGAALTLPPASSLVLFTVIALGLSMPYLVLSAFPHLVRMLPRPGEWMETFKQLMAFPLYATVVFLVWVLAGQVSDAGLLKALLGLVLIAMAGWGYGRWTQRGGETIRRRAFGFGFAALALTSAVAVGYPRATEDAWQEWSPDRVARLRAEGRLVYVDFTARWCVTCQSNKAAVFSSDEVWDALRRHDVALLKADWTNKNPEILRALNEFGRKAVPFNLIYPADGGEPIILPEILTPGIVLDALERAVKSSAHGAVAQK